jgi:dimeric dUTPase (all-alpha-NTP-PPase superfamily)
MKEYDKANAMNIMFDMQESLQNAIGAKRGTLCPNTWNSDIPDKYRTMAIESGYYMMSTVTELFEFFEQWKKDNFQFTDLVKFELIDAWHFVMNQLLYMNIKPTQTVEWFYEKAKENLEQVTFVNHDLYHIVGGVVETMGEIYQNSSYKKWKTYDKPKEDPLKLQVLAENFLLKFFELFVVTGMKPEDIWKFYYEKNAENFKRQEKGGRYEK